MEPSSLRTVRCSSKLSVEQSQSIAAGTSQYRIIEATPVWLEGMAVSVPRALKLAPEGYPQTTSLCQCSSSVNDRLKALHSAAHMLAFRPLGGVWWCHRPGRDIWPLRNNDEDRERFRAGIARSAAT